MLQGAWVWSPTSAAPTNARTLPQLHVPAEFSSRSTRLGGWPMPCGTLTTSPSFAAASGLVHLVSLTSSATVLSSHVATRTVASVPGKSVTVTIPSTAEPCPVGVKLQRACGNRPATRLLLASRYRAESVKD